MSKPVDVGRACKLCGEQITLHVESDGGYYTDDLGAIFRTGPTDTIIVEAHCGCSNPRSVTLTGTDGGFSL